MSADTFVRFERLAKGGDAVGRDATGRAVFAPYAAPGDQARVRIVAEHRRFARGEVAELLEPGPDRQAAPCPYFGTCGGCAWQHIRYDAQLAAKQAIVEKALGQAVSPIVRSPLEYGYRWRARQHVAGRTVGYRVRRGHALLDVASCPLLEEPLDRAIAAARQELPAAGDLYGLLGRDGRAALRCGSYRAGPEAANLAGPGERPFLCAPQGFAQPGPDGNRALRQLVRRLARATGRRVLELHAGVGNFTRDLVADGAEAVVAVEGVPEAGRTFAVNVPHGATFVGAEAGREVAARARAGERFDLVVLDPPREGAREVCRWLGRLKAERIVYVSCDPMTLARDLGELRSGGYGVEQAVPVDLMPQTDHVETVVALVRGGAGGDSAGSQIRPHTP